LLGRDRAIVSPIPGTTRDTIEETANIRGLPVIFTDTAGLREGGDEIEIEGIRRSRTALQQAEIILHVLDASAPLTEADESQLAEFATKQRLLILNKIDLVPPGGPIHQSINPSIHQSNPLTVSISCLTGQGIEA